MKTKNIFFAKKPFHTFKIYFDERIGTPDIYKFMSCILANKKLGSSFAIYKHSCMEAMEIDNICYDKNCDIPSDKNQIIENTLVGWGRKSLLYEDFKDGISKSLLNRRVFIPSYDLPYSILEYKINKFFRYNIFTFGRYSSSFINEDDLDFEEEIKNNTFDYKNDVLNTQCIVVYSENPICSSIFKKTGKYFHTNELLSNLELPIKFHYMVKDFSVCRTISNDIFKSITKENMEKLSSTHTYKKEDTVFLYACFIEYVLGASVILD